MKTSQECCLFASELGETKVHGEFVLTHYNNGYYLLGPIVCQTLDIISFSPLGWYSHWPHFICEEAEAGQEQASCSR